MIKQLKSNIEKVELMLEEVLLNECPDDIEESIDILVKIAYQCSTGFDSDDYINDLLNIILRKISDDGPIESETWFVQCAIYNIISRLANSFETQCIEAYLLEP